MSIVFASFSASLDGFIAHPNGDVAPLFDRYFNGDVEITPPGYPITFRMSEASARYWRQNDTNGVFIAGRKIFDYTNGWGGAPPRGSPTFVVTHRPPPPDWPPVSNAPFTFVESVTDALEQARTVARGKDIGVAGANIAQQCLNLGELDEIRIDLVPVLFHEGVRYLDNIDIDAIGLEHFRRSTASTSPTCAIA